jgi:hypothetical protein
MSTEVAATLGILAGLVAVADTVPYIRDTARGRTRPHRGTWLIWSVLANVAFLAQHADGAAWSLPMIGVQAGLTGVIFVLALPRGEGGVSRGEHLLVALAGAGEVGWLTVDEPLVATVCVVAADLIGVALMVPKTYRDPWSETFSTFALASVSGALAVGAVGALDASLLLYPVYYCLGNGCLALLIWWRRAALATPAAAPGIA